MCGICGAIRLRDSSGPALADDVLRAMTDVLRHRGPDDDGYHVSDSISIGVRRLSIVDVDGGHQPMTNEYGVTAAQNGELYNHRAVRARLEAAGHRFRTTCDTEILPYLYTTCGDAAPEHLNGIFAFVIWDSVRHRAVIARDRLGVKPMYYAEVGDLFLFGSELKALLASGVVSTEIDVEALDLYLSLGFVPGPLTLLRHVKKLLPGHRIVVEPPSVRVERYWRYPEPAPVAGRSEVEWRDELIDLLEDAVRTQLMSDVPLGAMLSGGLDSSVIASLMARNMTRPVKTFTVGFAGMPDNELAAARETARALGAEHHELELSLDDTVDLEALVWTLDEPLADLSSLGFSALSELASEHVTVALSGQGADELLAGYDRYRQVEMAARLTSAPLALRRVAASVARVAPNGLRRAMAVVGAADPVAAAVVARSEWADGSRFHAARGALQRVEDDLLERTIAARVAGSASSGVGRTLLLDGQLSLVDDMLHYFDRTSMAHSLEVRVPYLDHRLVEFCARMPTSLKLNNGTTKSILRKAAHGLVPDSVLDRPKVGFFSGAVDVWFEQQLAGSVGAVLRDPGARYTEYVDRTEVERLIGDPRSYRKSKLLLSILMLELWLSTYLRNATRPSVATV